MISMLYFTILFAVAYAIKGGQGDDVLSNWNKVRSRNKVLNRLLDGKVLSTALVLIGCAFYSIQAQVNLGLGSNATISVLFIGIAWLLSVAPSLGEEYGSIRNDLSSQYQLYFDREYGLKKAVQRGVWMGAMMTLATGYVGFIVASFAFVPLAWVSLNYIKGFKPFDAWGWSEVLIGAVCFGLPMGIMVL